MIGTLPFRIIDAYFNNYTVKVATSSPVAPALPTLMTGFTINSLAGAVGIGMSYRSDDSEITLLLDTPLTFDDRVTLDYSGGNVVLRDDTIVSIADTSSHPVLNNQREIMEDRLYLIFQEDIDVINPAQNFYVKVNDVPLLHNTYDSSIISVGINTYNGITTNVIQIILPQKVTIQDDVTVSYIPGNITATSGTLGMATYHDVYVNNRTTRYNNLIFNPIDWLEQPTTEIYNYYMIVGVDTTTFMTSYPTRLNYGDIIIPTYYSDQMRFIGISSVGVGTFGVTSGFTTTFIDTFSVLRNITPAVASLYERRIGYAQTSLEYDIDPPVGDVIINENASSSGIRIHWFKTYNNTNEVVPTAMTIQDSLGVNITNIVPENFGGSVDESTYVEIGPYDNRSLVAYMDNVSITEIQICANAQRAKSYIIEVTSDGKKWYPLVYMIADTRSRDFFSYAFTSPVTIYGIRIHYKGDFYAGGSIGDITVSAYDDMGEVSEVSIAHDYSMLDASDSTFLTNLGINSVGWAPYSEGVAQYDWPLMNSDRLWTAQTGMSTEPLNYITPLGSNFVVFSTNKAYLFNSNTGIMTFKQDLYSPILSYTTHNNQIYVGVQTGIIYTTTDGILYTPITTIPDTPLKPVSALASYSGLLWVGTDFTGQASPFAKLWTYNGTNYTLVRTFAQPEISVTKVINSSLYVGMKGPVDSKGALIYRYNGNSWSLSFSNLDDGVDDIEYSPITSSMWAAFTNGRVVTATFGTSVDPTWSTFATYTSDNHNYLKVYGGIQTAAPVNVGDRTSSFAWLCADTELISYIDTNMLVGIGSTYNQTTFNNVPWPSNFLSGLQATWRQGTDIPGTTYYSNVDSLGNFTAGITSTTTSVGPINYDFVGVPTSLPVGVGTTVFNVTFDGYIQAGTNETYTFYMPNSSGARLYIDNTLVIDDFSDHIYPLLPATGTFDMLAGLWYPFKLQYFNGYNVSCDGKLSLSWSSQTVTKDYVPKTSLINVLTRINAVYQNGGTIYGVSEDGNVYILDKDTLAALYRTVFVRLRDDLGNETPMIISSSYYGSPDYIFDFAVPDASRAEGGSRISGGKLTQIKQNKTISYILPVETAGMLYAPDRYQRQFGFYLSDPFYVATLTRWDKISFLVTLPYTNPGTDGLDSGVSAELYVKTSDTRSEVLVKDWGSPLRVTTIDGSTVPSNNLLVQFDISAYSGKWIMYRLVLTTASRSVTPVVYNVTVSYLAANASYFFSTLFDATKKLANYINYVRNPDFESDISTTPLEWDVSGVGLGLSIVTGTNNVIDGERSLRISADTTSVGSYVYTTPFFMEPKLADQSLLVQFDYKSNVGMGESAFQIEVRDNLLGIGLTVTPNYTLLGNGTFSGNFISTSLSTSGGGNFELRMVSLGSSTFDYTIDNVYVGPIYSPMITEPLFRRGLLTANYALNGGELVFGYTTDDTLNNTFDFSNFTQIIPNKTFEILIPASKIRFGMALVSVGSTAVYMDEYAVQLDVGPYDLKWMEYNDSISLSPITIYISIVITTAYHYIFVDASAGDVIITLPSAIGINGVDFVIKKIDTTTNKVIVTPVVPETIDYASDYIISTYLSSVMVVSNGSNWYTV